jgi:hypothetical protein
MYGFHKIPHLQQGVLKSDSTTEHWQFVHDHFRRGEEDRLVFIERKKQQTQPKTASGSGEQQSVMLLPPSDPTQSNAPTALDINSIVTGIAAIRRHQSTISSELSDLKQSNEALWRESMEARTRHTQQQDTVNRIIRFLAGIFGQQGGASSHSESDPGPSNAGAVIPRTRLMIEDRERSKDPHNKVRVVEVEDEDARDSPSSQFHTSESECLLTLLVFSHLYVQINPRRLTRLISLHSLSLLKTHTPTLPKQKTHRTTTRTASFPHKHTTPMLTTLTTITAS